MAKSKARKRPSSKLKAAHPNDAIALLRAGHSKVEDLFAQFEKARDATRKKKPAESICMELTIHTQIEEEVFYPAAREALPKEEDLLDEA